MKKRNHPNYAASPARANDDPAISWFYVVLTIACAAFLAIGFFFAAQQHFASMDLGMKNSKLRKQIEEMEAQQRQLLLSREMGRSPAEVKRTALNKGFREREVLMTAATVVKPAARPMIQRTSMSAPTLTSSPDKQPVKAFFAPERDRVVAKTEIESKESGRAVLRTIASKLR